MESNGIGWNRARGRSSRDVKDDDDDDDGSGDDDDGLGDDVTARAG